MTRYVNGMYLDRKDFRNGGMIIKGAIDMNRFYEQNPTNEKGYCNFEIKFNKETDKPYAVINEYYHKETDEKTTQENAENLVNFDEISEEEIPF